MLLHVCDVPNPGFSSLYLPDQPPYSSLSEERRFDEAPPRNLRGSRITIVALVDERFI